MKILKFGAVWCMQCLVMRPIWEEIEAEIDKIKAGNPQLKDKIDSQFADSHERQRLQSAIGGRKAVAKLMEIVRQK